MLIMLWDCSSDILETLRVCLEIFFFFFFLKFLTFSIL
jgi:hypothetical protein